MALLILRLVFLMVAAGLGFQLVQSKVLPGEDQNWPTWLPAAAFAGIMLLAVATIAIDIASRRKRLDVITSVYFGLIIGLFLTYVTKLAISPVLPAGSSEASTWISLILGMVLCYACTSVLMQTRNDFRFIIPYVEFAKQLKGLKPLVLDTSVVIDGRIADLVETRVIDNQLVMPQFVIGELQAIADSSDKLRRSKGRRGLDILNRLRSDQQVELVIFDRELPEFGDQPVDQKLVILAKHLEGKIVTNDYNLNKVAKLQNVGVVNLNDVANSLKPVFLPGEKVEVRVIKAGEEASQGVGYLDDGTMVVIDGGRDHIGQQVSSVVTSVLQTSAGRMVFAKFERETGTA
ncbi:putative PIN and TRAM-domain containing protein precursor [Posidoniimonas polymericola]|uniref:Putative PIN and TRAM-domain containing protein n=1 Tax=Posidoniimonas polymericola TaxID=2528002 RepID=A0A5C5YFK2_9BACT|nr:PIN domain-containing protein [Posidoniimonas polymericola]TWT73719.1 putative PIN and TRAM-domain containing protein precursor [Posidoniimonas polymericola]